MKTCAECQSPVPGAVLACPACGCGVFAEASTPDAPKRAESDLATLAKWAIGYVLSVVLLGVATAILAQMLLRSGSRAAAQGIATSPVMLVPLLTVLFFAYFASRYRNPFMRAGALYLAISVLGFGVHLLGREPVSAYLGAAVYTLVCALIGTVIAFFFRPKGVEA